jgi:hypothetical protein
MRDKKDNATLDLVGFDHDSLPSIAIPTSPASSATPAPAAKKRSIRPRSSVLQQEQLELLDATDASGLPVWQRDEHLDLTGLPVWAAA